MAVVPEVAVVLFPGTNCERETMRAVEAAGGRARLVWHEEHSLGDAQAVIVPGGFSYGDYLRAGVIARTSPIMQAVSGFADDGGAVLGICNGFQVLTETGLLPGALLTNASLTFIHKWQRLQVAGRDARWWDSDVSHVRFPIAHHQGNFYIAPESLDETLADALFLYENAEGMVADPDKGSHIGTEDGNPNGSVRAIAGVRNAAGNVLGLMPHPERALLSMQGSQDGMILFRSLVASLA